MAPATSAARLHGDEADLFRRFNARLLHATRRSVHAPDAVIEDACATAWLQLVRCQPRRDTVFAWLKRVAQREAWRLASREQREAPLPDESATVPGLALDLELEARAALARLAELPARQRDYLTLLIAGHSYDDIVELRDTSLTAVNRHLVRARASLRRNAADAD